MAVDERGIIDFVSAGKDGTVTLSVADHLSWADEQQHLYRLQEKLNRYMDFINNGELAEKFPEVADLRPLIKFSLFILLQQRRQSFYRKFLL
jgi:hypothetical protein